MPAPIPVLFTHYGENWIRGSERGLLDLLTHLDPRRVQPIVWCNGVAMAEAAKAAGFTTYRTEFEFYFDYGSPPFNVQRYWSFVRQGIELVRKHRIRLLHANSAAPSQWLAPVARFLRQPLLAHLHSDYLRRSRYVFLLHQSSLVVGVSRRVVDDFIRDGMDPRRTRVIYNGIDIDRFHPSAKASSGRELRRRLGIAENAVVISGIGSLIHRKGYDILIRAFRALGPVRDAHLLIVSDGPERANLERLAAELDVKRRVHFLGYFDELGAVYNASDITALASRAEAFGAVLAEAGFFAIPTVSTTVGGIPEVVEHEASGLLVPPDDPQSFAAALSRLIDDPSYRLKLGTAAKKRAESTFTVDRLAANFHETYERLVNLPRYRFGWLDAAVNIRPYFRLLHSATPKSLTL